MTASERPRLGAILLAAGGSSRLGQPKQLIDFKGETLIRRAARLLSNSVYFPVVAVLGAGAELMAAELADLPAYYVINDEWQEGMGSSIRSGLTRLLEIETSLDGVLITLCDQPFITTEMLDRFAANFSQTNAQIVAAAYQGTTGVPALFSRKLFDQLLTLESDKGARQLIRSQPGVSTIELPEAAIDLDTAADLDRFGITNS